MNLSIFSRLKLGTKLAIGGTLLAVIPALAIGVFSGRSSQATVLDQSKVSLLNTANVRANRIAQYFGTIDKQIVNFAQNPFIVDATREFAQAFANVPAELEAAGVDTTGWESDVRGYYEGEFKPRFNEAGGAYRGAASYVPASDAGVLLQAMYLANNPNAVGSKLDLDRSGEEIAYNELHEKYHPFVRRFLLSYGYYDIFLFDTDGNLIYSVYKETDYATNFMTGPYKDTNFADVVRAGLAIRAPGERAIVDFKQYEPSYGAAASFVSSPVFDNGKKIGVAVFQMPIDRINDVVTDGANLLDTGHALLIGADGLLRAADRLDENAQTLVDSPAELATFDPATKVGAARNAAGDEVVVAAVPIDIPGVDFTLLTSITKSELLAPHTAIQNKIFLAVGGAAVFAAIGALFFSRLISRRVVMLRDKLRHDRRGRSGPHYADRLR